MVRWKRVCTWLAIVTGFCVPLPGEAQIRFERTYGGPDDDLAYSVKQTADGGYIIAGYSWSFSGGEEDVYLIRTDECGDTVWTRSFGGPWEDTGRAVELTEDGGYIVAGRTRSFDHGWEDVYLIKTDSGGDTIWTRAHGRYASDGAYSVEQTSDGGYIVAGRTWLDAYLVKTDAAGDTLWTRAYGGPWDYRWYSVEQTADGRYIVAGEIYHDEWYWSYSHVYLIRADAVGETLWTRRYYTDEYGYHSGWSVATAQDGGYIIAGEASPEWPVRYDVYLIRTDAEGEVLWARTYGGQEDDRGRSLAKTSDGGYVVAGYTDSFGAGGWDFYLIKTDAAGETLWTRTYGGTGDDVGWSVDQTSDGGYVIAGYTNSFGAGGWDVYLIKTDANGYVEVAEDDVDGPSPYSSYLAQNRPNPFRTSTEILYTLPDPQRVTIAIYDIRGALVRTLVRADLSAGQHRAVWDGRDERGEKVASGVYFCCLEASGCVEARRLVLLR